MSCNSYLIFACRDVKHKKRSVILEDYLTYRHRVMLDKVGTRARISHNTRSGTAHMASSAPATTTSAKATKTSQPAAKAVHTLDAPAEGRVLI
jgi:guanyl-specific ribonuclease Sa